MSGYRSGPSDLRESIEEMSQDRRRAARESAQTVQARLEQLTLASEAMWSLLREKLALTDDDLRRRMVDLDLSDGTLDGVKRRAPKNCSKCERVIPHRVPRCIYCGRPTDIDPFAT